MRETPPERPAPGRRTMPVPTPSRTKSDARGLSGALRARGWQGIEAPREHDGQPPRRQFGGPQQAEHGAVEMARQRCRPAGAARAELDHGDERGENALQRLAVLFDHQSVHRRLLRAQAGDYAGGCGGVWMKLGGCGGWGGVRVAPKEVPKRTRGKSGWQLSSPQNVAVA